MKSKENIEKKGFRRLSDEELKEVTGGIHIVYKPEDCMIPSCDIPLHPDIETCQCVY